MTRSIDSDQYKNYLKKAEGSLSIAKIAITKGAHDNAVMSAVHSAINALDALTTSYLGKRASGSHTDALSLVKGIFDSGEYHDLQKQYSSLISMKNASEYEADLMRQEDAEKAVKWAERIINKVKDKLKTEI
ncbi:MAG: HEPN domain-containing protein [Nitrososphaera sp.]